MSVDPKDLAIQFVLLVLTDLEAIVVLDHPTSGAPRPLPLPAAGILIQSDAPDGWQTPVAWAQDTGVSVPPAKFPYHLEWTLDGQLLVALYGDGSVERARAIRISPASPAVLEWSATNGIAFKNGVTVNNTAEILDTTREARATVQFDVVWAERVTSQIDVIETVTPVITTPDPVDP